ncbi:MAG TPA: WhiB family transcriptional regulator [Acidimicrobiales bacterium]|nr:WhiB family transcriptional regulator [Acidimicrobiales bacterium]
MQIDPSGTGFGTPGWHAAAACRSLPKSLFFPVGTTGTAADDIVVAKTVCGTCEVRASCLAFSLVTEQHYGVWGGTDEQERSSLRRVYRAAGLEAAVAAAFDGTSTSARSA